MPEMSVVLKAMTRSSPYRLIAQRIVLPWSLQGLRPSGEVLEIGSGSGAMAARLLATHPRLHLTATDYDPEMLALTVDAVAPFGDRASTRHVDANTLPFPDNHFDAVLSCAMLHHVITWEAALTEAVRVLRPGGHLVGYDLLHRVPRLRAAAHDARIVHIGQMENHLRDLPVTDIRIRRSVGRFAIRFLATKRPRICRARRPDSHSGGHSNLRSH